MKEKEHSLRLQNTMDAITRALSNDQKMHGQIAISSGASSGPVVLSSKLSDHQLPVPLPTASTALRRLTEAVQKMFGDLDAALTDKDPGDTDSTPSTTRYALNVSLRSLQEAVVVAQLSTATVEKRAARVSDQLNDTPDTAPSVLTQIEDGATAADQNAVSMADMAITNQRLSERLRLIKERAVQKEQVVSTHHFLTQTNSAHTAMHSLTTEPRSSFC